MLESLQSGFIFDETGTQRLIDHRPRYHDRMRSNAIVNIFNDACRSRHISLVANRNPDASIDNDRCHQSDLVISRLRVRRCEARPSGSSPTAEEKFSSCLVGSLVSINDVNSSPLVRGDVLLKRRLQLVRQRVSKLETQHGNRVTALFGAVGVQPRVEAFIVAANTQVVRKPDHCVNRGVLRFPVRSAVLLCQRHEAPLVYPWAKISENHQLSLCFAIGETSVGSLQCPAFWLPAESGKGAATRAMRHGPLGRPRATRLRSSMPAGERLLGCFASNGNSRPRPCRELRPGYPTRIGDRHRCGPGGGFGGLL